MEAHTLEALWAFIVGAACGVTLEAFTVTRKWKEISRKWKEQATRSTATATASLQVFRAASNHCIDQAEAIDDLFRTWEKYRDEAANVPTPESPFDKFARIAEADCSIRKAMDTLREKTGQRHRDAEAIARSLQVPQGPQEGRAVRPEERSEEGQR